MIYVIVTAAGTGSRFGARIPKQFCLLGGRPMLCHTIDNIHNALPQAKIVLTLDREACDYWERLCHEYQYDTPPIIIGGATRYHSVKAALEYIAGMVRDEDMILVHDGARPLVRSALCRRITDSLTVHDAVIPAIPVTDSLRAITAEGHSQAVDRSSFRAVQTPQGFKARIILDAYKKGFSPMFTDDASVVEAAGHKIFLCEGDSTNIKITHPADMETAEILLKTME